MFAGGRDELLSLTMDEIHELAQRQKKRPGRWTMPGRLAVPEFLIAKVEPAELPGEYAKAYIVCPRRECGNGFTVWAEAWMVCSTYRTRVCPYCFKVAKVPKELMA